MSFIKRFSGEVELENSFGRKIKYHRGNPNIRTKVWIFGMVQTCLV